MTRENFVKGMAALCENFSREQTPSLVELFWGSLSQLTDDEWARAMSQSIGNDEFFPTVARLLRYARPQKPEAVVRSENKARAQEVYEQIIDAFEGGRPLSSAKVEAEFGYAAKVAFGAAGGHGAFAWCDPRNEPFRRKAFIEAFEEVGTVQPEAMAALPSAEPVAAIAGGIFTPRIPELPQTKRETIVLVPPRPRVTQKEELAALAERDRTSKPITDSDERRALLKAQAEQIKSEDTGGKS